MSKSEKQLAAEAELQGIASMVEQVLPDGMGFAVLVFEKNRDAGHIGWVANGRRSDMRRALAEFLSKWDAESRGGVFYPLTLDGLEAWAAAKPGENFKTLQAIREYARLSNAEETAR